MDDLNIEGLGLSDAQVESIKTQVKEALENEEYSSKQTKEKKQPTLKAVLEANVDLQEFVKDISEALKSSDDSSLTDMIHKLQQQLDQATKNTAPIEKKTKHKRRKKTRM